MSSYTTKFLDCLDKFHGTCNTRDCEVYSFIGSNIANKLWDEINATIDYFNPIKESPINNSQVARVLGVRIIHCSILEENEIIFSTSKFKFTIDNQ